MRLGFGFEHLVSARNDQMGLLALEWVMGGIYCLRFRGSGVRVQLVRLRFRGGWDSQLMGDVF